MRLIWRPAAAAACLFLIGCSGSSVPARLDPPPGTEPTVSAQTMTTPGHIVVTVSADSGTTPEALAARHGLEFVAAWPLAAISVDCFVFRVDPVRVEVVINAMLSDATVLDAQPMYSFQTAAAEGRVRQPNLEAINALRAHRTTTGAGVTVGVIDTAISVLVPDLASTEIEHRDFVEDGRGQIANQGERHGTAVAGVIGAQGRITGVAPDARLIGFRACWETELGGACNTVSLARALNAAVLSQVDIVNLSLAGPSDPLLSTLLEAVARNGAMVVAAAGPPGRDFPASHPDALAVGSAHLDGVPVDLIAPGRDVISLTPDGGYDFYSGSSIAAAHATGVAALAVQLGATPAGVAAAMTALDDDQLDACGLLSIARACER